MSSVVGKIVKFSFSLYLLTSLIFTFVDWVIKPSLSLISQEQSIIPSVLNSAEGAASWSKSFLGGQSGAGDPDIQDAHTNSVDIDFSKSAYKAANFHRTSITGLQWGNQILQWNTSAGALTVPMSEDFFLSKSFGDSLGPSKVIPYYFKAKGEFDKEDITITTLITSNRFKVFSDLVERYQGPISVCIHSPPSPAILKPILKSLQELYESSPSFATYVDVHLVIDPFERQFNMWRNVAKFFARTDYVLMLDVDFWIASDFRSTVRNLQGEAKKMLRDGTMALVIPAFEYNVQEDGLDHNTFPTTKLELLELVKAKKIDMFHKSWVPGHGPTNYTRYYETKPGEIYKISGYTHSYEPYAIFRRDSPWCDERFIGYGGNKAACLYELYLSNIAFYVLPDDFLIHQSHPYLERTRSSERRYNRRLFANFREELCYRYLVHFVDGAQVKAPRIRNLMTECQKINGFKSLAERYIRAVQDRAGLKQS